MSFFGSHFLIRLDGVSTKCFLKRSVIYLGSNIHVFSAIREASQPFDSSKLSAEVVPENDVKRKKKQQKKEQKANKAGSGDQSEVHMENKTQSEEAETDNANQVLPVASELDQKLNDEK